MRWPDGQKIGNYRLIRPIGNGNAAEVYLVNTLNWEDTSPKIFRSEKYFDYMAPEQISGRYLPASDQYALGLIRVYLDLWYTGAPRYRFGDEGCYWP